VIHLNSILDQGWVQSADWYETLDSTNSQIKRELKEATLDNLDGLSCWKSPRLVVASQQTAGRGRGDHAWWSPSGCLMSSLAIMEEPNLLPSISYIVAIAIARTLESEFEEPSRIKIKWPNDIFLDGKKIAGVLIERVADRSQGVLIIGSGINVAVDFAKAPADVCSRAVSLTSSFHVDSNSLELENEKMTQILSKLIRELQIAIQSTREGSSWWNPEWTKRCYLVGKRIEATVSHWENRISEARISDTFLPLGTVTGNCLGLSPDGHLQIEHESGSIGRIVSGSVRLV